MKTEETQTQGVVGSEPEFAAESQQATTASLRKIEANRRNAQHSTGPKTVEGKARSSQNAITHGIFFNQLVNGASPETVAELETLAADLRAYYQPLGRLEEMLVEKIVVENARYARILGFEQQELSRRLAFFGPAVDRVGRYTTSTNRALFRAIEELDRVQAARKARDGCAPSAVRESVGPAAKVAEEQQASHGSDTATDRR